MELETLVANSAETLIRSLTRTIAALGGVIFLYLVFNIINFIINKKRGKEIREMNEKLDKIIRLLGKRKK